MDNNSIVISGIAGRFPKSRNLLELKHNLYNGIDMVTEKQGRWPPVNGLPPRMGFLEDIDKFDLNYFGVLAAQANAMDPQLRFLLELCVEAMFDAGINPVSMRNSRTNVYVVTGFPDASYFNIYDEIYSDIGSVYGSTTCALANRLSYQFNFTGTSMVIETACSGALIAILNACNAMKQGQCDAAIVAGANILTHPNMSKIFNGLSMTSPTGYCKPFDDECNGFVRSEAAEVIILQRECDAKRIYANIVHIASNSDGFKQEGYSYPSKYRQKELFENFYNEINLNPNEVDYIEMHGTGTKAGDPVECWAVDQVFNQKRRKPLLIGSIKSNMGHTENFSAGASIAKAIFTFENGLIPPSIHFKTPNKNIPSLCEGKLKVCTEITPLSGQYYAINSFGFGGVNGHLLLKSSSKMKVNKGSPNDELPRLVLWSGRTKEAVKKMFDHICNETLDAEFVGLTHEIQKLPVYGHMNRGYGIFENTGPAQNAISLEQHVTKFDDIKRPIVWMLTGMGSQWLGMINGLMKIRIFRETIEKCHKVLMEHNYDLISILESTDIDVINDIINSMVSITAIEIGLIEILKMLNIPMDFVIGHSLGEVAVGYADESFTLEQTILCSYFRGLCSKKAQLIDGRMYAIGLGYNDIKNLLPDRVYCACRNSSTSSTISGPKSLIEKFVAELHSKKIFAKEVNTNNIAYHSKYIQPIAELFLPKLKTIIPEPKKRSSKWLSTCYAQNEWSKPCAMYLNAEYQVHNLLNTVLLEDILKILPKDAIIIEIAPCGLLQAIVKRELPNNIHIPLLLKNSDNLLNLMKAFGKLFEYGVNMDIEKLYPAIEFPVTTSTAMIAPLIKWDHSQSWRVPTIGENQSNDGYITKKIDISLSDPKYQYMEGHVIDGRCLLPGTGYINIVRDTFIENMYETEPDKVAVKFEDIQFLRATMLTTSKTVQLAVRINRSNGHFEISENASNVVCGIIRRIHNAKPIDNSKPQKYDLDCIELTSDDFYRDLRVRGYTYEKEFCAVQSARTDGKGMKVKWCNNWTTFMDNMLQSKTLSIDSRSLALPTTIRHIQINAQQHMDQVEKMKSDSDESVILDVYVDNELDSIRCGGIEITGMLTNFVARRKQLGVEAIDRYEFIPLDGSGSIHNAENGARVAAQLIIELSNAKSIKAVEYFNDEFESQIAWLQKAFSKIPQIYIDFKMLVEENKVQNVAIEDIKVIDKIKEQIDLLILPNYLLNDTNFMSGMKKTLCKDGFLISLQSAFSNERIVPNGFHQVSDIICEKYSLTLLRVNNSDGFNERSLEIIHLKSNDMKFEWLKQAQAKLKSSSVLIVSENERYSGVMGLLKCLAKENINQFSIQCVEIDDETAPKFDLMNPFYANHLQKLKFPFNIYRNGKWGTYRHLALEKPFRDQPTLKAVKEVYTINIEQIGNLSSFNWTISNLSLNDKKDLIKVCYSTINFHDVMIASGRLLLEDIYKDRLQSRNYFTFEYSGINSDGKRVFGIRKNHGMATYAHSEIGNVFTWNVPDNMTLQGAATIPAVYGTLYYAFFCRSTIRSGQSILIHSGCGGIGLGAITIAFAYGLDVFTTVSTDIKKEYLLKKFPQLKKSQIGNSRDCSFEKMIMLETNGKGVDIVLNSLSDDKLIATSRCLSDNGTFIEIGKFDILNDTKLGMRLFSKEVTFIPIFFDRYDKLPLDKIHKLIETDLQNGIIQPLPTTVFTPNEVDVAFKYLGSGKHIGKVLIQLRNEEDTEEILPMKVILKGVFKGNQSYVIVGGLGDFGMEFVDWMITKGARNILISSRRQPWSSYQLYRIRLWESYGCNIKISNSDVTTLSGCEKLLREASALSPVGGIFNLAVVLRDNVFKDQSPTAFYESLAPKAIATTYLDQLSRTLCPNLEYFVIFSSVSCGMGNIGQSNYAMANAIMERIVESRCKEKLPGKAIQWGAIDDVGSAYKLVQSKSDGKNLSGFGFQNINNCLNVVDTLLMSPEPIVSSYIVKQKVEMKKRDLASIVLDSLGINDISSISVNSTMTELGMDSLINNEIKQLLKHEFNINISTEQLRELTVKQLIEMNKVTNEVNEKTNTKEKHISHRSIAKINSIPDKGDECILFIPGHEGIISDQSQVLCEKLHQPVFGLSFHHTRHMNSINEIVENFSEEVLQFYENRKSFHLVAYSFGSIIAIEIAHLLEKAGLKGRIHLIDGSPKILSAELLSKKFTLLDQFIHYQNIPLDVREKYDSTNNLESKISILITYFGQAKGRQAQHLNEIYSSMMTRFRICIEACETQKKLIKSNIVIIKASQKLNDSDDGVEELTCGNVKRHIVNGTHMTVMDNEMTPKLVRE